MPEKKSAHREASRQYESALDAPLALILAPRKSAQRPAEDYALPEIPATPAEAAQPPSTRTVSRLIDRIKEL